jgi:putative intracellular protease/amidase
MPVILLALTSHSQLGNTGRPTGFYVPEAMYPCHAFTAAGYDVAFTSVQGGQPPVTGVEPGDAEVAAFLRDHAGALADTPIPGQLDPVDYDAIFYVGGHGAMWDFPGCQDLARLAAGIYARGGVIAAVCHGPAGLADLQLDDGSYLVDGKRLTAFTNEEEAATGLAGVVPFALETRLTERGARFTGKAAFTAHAVADGRLITGQNPASAASTAELTLLALASARPRPARP